MGGAKSPHRKEPIMCYEFSSWHWKARAKELHRAQVKAGAEERKEAPTKPVEETRGKRPEVKEPDKVPA
jgi:hypothetical protein